MAAPKTWYVVRIKDNTTLSSAKELGEAERICLYFNEEEKIAVVSPKSGKGFTEVTGYKKRLTGS
jgi:hypothetical protein